LKILQLRFNNLNSLCGEWSIDFTAPEYMADGIFAITGPTGAGKTTILDAVCLALYGRTPRLKSISKSGNEIMSRQTGECFAEATFETGAGIFRCHWSQHKARKKADGNLTDSKHEISDAVTGKILESKKRDVAEAVEKKTGMDFERFTRSMLLAQGDFAAFLQASADERAPILEQITGTKIYSDISIRVHERKREEHRKLELLQAKSDVIRILDEEDEKRFSDELNDKEKTEIGFAKQKREIDDAIVWLENISDIQKLARKREAEIETIKADIKQFEPDKKRLEKAMLAAELDAEYAILSSQKENQKEEGEFLADSEIVFPQRKEKLSEKKEIFERAESIFIKVKEEQKKEFELIDNVRELDIKIKEKSKNRKKVLSEQSVFQSIVISAPLTCFASLQNIGNFIRNLFCFRSYGFESFFMYPAFFFQSGKFRCCKVELFTQVLQLRIQRIFIFSGFFKIAYHLFYTAEFGD